MGITRRVGAAIFALAMLTFTQAAHAQGGSTKALTERKSAPTGAEVAAAARGAVLDHAKSVTAQLLGKPFKFTPAQTRSDKPVNADAGAFLGVLENGAAGDETGLPPGRYNIFVTRVNGQWKGYAESDGRIVREAIRTTTSSGDAKPSFQEKGWCYKQKIYFLIPPGVTTVTICF